MSTKTLLVSLACALPLAINAFGQGVNAANGNLGDWLLWNPNPAPDGSYTGLPGGSVSLTGGPSGAGYTTIPDAYPNQDGGAYTFFGQGSSATPALVSSHFSQSIAIYLDPTSPSYQSGSVVIDETPASTVLNSGSYSLWGAENGFALTGTGSAITVAQEIGGAIGTVTTAGWYDFDLEFSTTEEVLSVYDLTTADSLVGSTISSIVPGDDLAGSGYLWFTERDGGFADDPLNVADLGANSVPDGVSTLAMLGGVFAVVAAVRRRLV